MNQANEQAPPPPTGETPPVTAETSAPATDSTPPAPSPAEAAVAQAAAISQELEAWKDRYLRLRADFDNYRKRTTRDLGDARTQGTSNALNQLLPVIDQLNLASQTIEGAQDVASLKQGFTMIGSEFQRSLEALGVERIATVGKPFDPTLHEAVATEASAEVAEGQVLREWKAGYKVGERILRVASVIVSKGQAGA